MPRVHCQPRLDADPRSTHLNRNCNISQSSQLRDNAALIQGRHCLADMVTTGGASHSKEKRPLHRGNLHQGTAAEAAGSQKK